MNKTLLRQMTKATAMRDMQGNWWKAFLIILIEYMVTFWIISYLPFRIPSQAEIMSANGDYFEMLKLLIPETIDGKTILSAAATVLLLLFVISPLSIGTSRFYLKVAKSEKGTMGDVFSAYTSIKTVFGSIAITIIIFLFMVISMAIFMAIPVLLIVLAYMYQSKFLLDFALLAATAFAVLFLVWTGRYRFISYIYARGDTTVLGALGEYAGHMKKHLKESLVLGASYLGWHVIIYMLPFLSFVYTCLSSTVYAKYLCRFRGELSFGERDMPRNEPTAERPDEEDTTSSGEE